MSPRRTRPPRFARSSTPRTTRRAVAIAERELAILIRARDLASKTLRGVGKEVDTLSGKVGKGLATTAKNITKLSVAGAGLAIVLTAGAVNAAGDFEAQLNTINTVAQETPAHLEAIGDGIRKIARDTGAPLEELTQGFYDLVSAGIDSGQAMQVLAASNKLAIGGLASAAEGVDLITTALNSYGVAAEDQGKMSERFADIFAKAIERGKVTAAELAASFAEIGPLAASNGIEIEELAAAYATLTAKGIPAGQAATFMSSALIALTRRTGALEKLEKQTGKSYLAIAGKQGLVTAFEQLRKDAEKAGVPLIDLVGRQEALQFGINTTGDALATYTDNLNAMSDANGTAARQMSERQQGLNYQIARLKALAIDAGITIGSKLIPKLIPLGEKLLALVTGHEADIEAFGDNLAAAFDKAIAFGERIPWKAIGSGLQTAAEWAGRLMDVFLGLPPEVQTTIIALAGLNKLSGGAVSGIVGELGKGLIKGVLGMNAGVVNIKAATVTGGGPGGVVGGPVGSGSKLATAASIASKVFIVGAAAGIFAELLGARNEQSQANKEGEVALGAKNAVFVKSATLDDMKTALAGIEGYQARLTNELTPQGIAYQANLDGIRTTVERQAQSLRDAIEAQKSGTQRTVGATERAEAIATQKANEIKGAQAAAAALAAGDSRSERASIAAAGAANTAATARAAAASRAAGQQAAAAIRDKDLSFRLYQNITTKVSIRDQVAKIQTQNKYGAIAS